MSDWMIKCQRCGKCENGHSPRAKYCRACRPVMKHKARNARQPLWRTMTCSHCGRECKKGSPAQKYCPSCFEENAREMHRIYSARYERRYNHIIKICEFCGVAFRKMTGTQKWCSVCGPWACQEIARASELVKYWDNPKIARAAARKYRETNLEAVGRRMRRWRAANIPHIKEYDRLRYRDQKNANDGIRAAGVKINIVQSGARRYRLAHRALKELGIQF